MFTSNFASICGSYSSVWSSKFSFEIHLLIKLFGYKRGMGYLKHLDQGFLDKWLSEWETFYFVLLDDHSLFCLFCDWSKNSLTTNLLLWSSECFDWLKILGDSSWSNCTIKYNCHSHERYNKPDKSWKAHST